ncbi:MAG: NADAR family protein [Planctomycetota bacterium]|jgi:ribA/ribD-fused uncharacterized protein
MPDASSTIRFFRAGDVYGYLANFFRSPFTLDGHQWPTVEHYFQAQKFAGTRHADEVRLAPTPGEAARMGRSRQRPLRRDWEAVKDDVMRRAVRAKFEQIPTLRRQLLSTGDAILVEHTHRDAYWGDCGDGRGRNMLGVILMETREALRHDGPADAEPSPPSSDPGAR